MLAVRGASLVVLASSLSLGCGSDDEAGGDGPVDMGSGGAAGAAGAAGAGGMAGGDVGEGRTGKLFEYAPADQDGLYPIGVTNEWIVDESRPELTTPDPNDGRTTWATIWYPAAESSRGQPTASNDSYFPPALAGAVAGLAPDIATAPSKSVRDAPIAEDGPFPLIVFSHGNGSFGAQSFFLTEYLASHGYIVVCPDHTGNSLFTAIGDTPITAGANGYSLENTLADRPADVSYMVDHMTEVNEADPNGIFTGAVDLENIGVTGHSFGGLTTLLVLDSDDRFTAGAPMAAAARDEGFITEPVMHFLATEDHTLSNDPIVSNYGTLQGPKMMVWLADAGHYSFSNACLTNGLIGDGDGCGSATRLDGSGTVTFLEDTIVFAVTKFYQTALWGYYLKDVTEYADDLLAEPWPEHVTLERDAMP